MVDSIPNWKDVVVPIGFCRRVWSMMEASTILLLCLADDTESLTSLQVEAGDLLVMLAAEANRILSTSVHRLLEVSVALACQVWLHNQKAFLIDD